MSGDLQPRLQGALRDTYRLKRELGRGGMATVYLAEDLKHHRQVAVKVLRPELAAVLGAERFLREIRLTARPRRAALWGLLWGLSSACRTLASGLVRFTPGSAA